MLERIITPQLTTRIAEPFFRFFGRRDLSNQIAPHDIKSVLVVKLDGIGDMILASSFLRELRTNLPKAFISLVVAPHLLNLVELCPYVDEVIPFPWKPTGRLGNLKRFGRVLWLSVKYLWHRRFDMTFVPHWEADWYEASSLSYYSGATRRVGYSETVNEGKKVVNKGFDLFYTDAIRDSSVKHEVERNLQLLQYVGFKVTNSSLECWLSPHDDLTARQILQGFSARTEGPSIVFGIGGNHPRKIWPSENFTEIGFWLRKHYQARILIVGGQQEMGAARKIQNSLGRGVVNMAGLLTLRQTAALIRYSVLYLGNDTGPMHMAAANKVPVIEISCHPVNGAPGHVHSPDRFGPWGVSHIVLKPNDTGWLCNQECSAPEAHCILHVTIAEVKAACQKMLEKKNN